MEVSVAFEAPTQIRMLPRSASTLQVHQSSRNSTQKQKPSQPHSFRPMSLATQILQKLHDPLLQRDQVFTFHSRTRTSPLALALTTTSISTQPRGIGHSDDKIRSQCEERHAEISELVVHRFGHLRGCAVDFLVVVLELGEVLLRGLLGLLVGRWFGG